jgi:three-Cys-motif partner protein
MPSKDLFEDPFDDGTLYKLKIIREYFKAWLPVFISSKSPIWKKIQIFDLFAGPGKDVQGVYGSPLIILDILNENKDRILSNHVKVRVVLNEKKQGKFQCLVSATQELEDTSGYQIEKSCNDFRKVFDANYESMVSCANFLLLDQGGVKEITEEIFHRIIKLRQTDFILFISSSYLNRFGDSLAFQKYLKLNKQSLVGKDYYHIHRIVLNYYRSLIPANKKYYLAPFTIRKPTGVYGLVFGSNHIYGLEKFLSVCWKHDKLTGEANFDIDREKIHLSKPYLFEELNVPKKIQAFEENLKDKILAGRLKTNAAVYFFGLEEGFLPAHVNKVMKELIRKKNIEAIELVSSKVHKLEVPSKIVLIN